LQINLGNGGRKIGIVIDSSGSNLDTDPNDLRVVAGRTLNSALVTAAGATGGKQPDLVTVVDFDYSATVIYGLGDPAGAGPSFSSIDSSGGTYIAEGVKAAYDELTKQNSGSTADRTGIIVLTDGEDSSADELVTEIQRAGNASIKVSFGFLSPSGSSPSYPEVLSAILNTGGIFRTVDTDSAQQAFISTVLANGLTTSDGGTDVSSILISGLSIAASSNSNGPNTFTYTGTAGEKINITITALEKQTLDGSIRDASGTELTTGSINAAGVAALTLDLVNDGPLSVLVSAASGSGLFTIGLNSSLGVSNCTLVPPVTNGTSGGGGGNNATVTPSAHLPTATGKPPQFTGAAAAVNVAGASTFGLLAFFAAALL
ncbi:hypothetical protein P152DRAFT_405120, partial [Eremomyces bilateralis CBS 781.70]